MVCGNTYSLRPHGLSCWTIYIYIYDLNGFRCPSANIILAYTDGENIVSERWAKADCSYNVNLFANDNTTFGRMFTCVHSKSRGWMIIRILVSTQKLHSNTQARSHSQTTKAWQAYRRLFITWNAYWTDIVLSAETQDYKFNKTVSEIQWNCFGIISFYVKPTTIIICNK